VNGRIVHYRQSISYRGVLDEELMSVEKPGWQHLAKYALPCFLVCCRLKITLLVSYSPVLMSLLETVPQGRQGGAELVIRELIHLPICSLAQLPVVGSERHECVEALISFEIIWYYF